MVRSSGGGSEGTHGADRAWPHFELADEAGGKRSESEEPDADRARKSERMLQVAPSWRDFCGATPIARLGNARSRTNGESLVLGWVPGWVSLLRAWRSVANKAAAKRCGRPGPWTARARIGPPCPWCPAGPCNDRPSAIPRWVSVQSVVRAIDALVEGRRAVDRSHKRARRPPAPPPCHPRDARASRSARSALKASRSQTRAEKTATHLTLPTRRTTGWQVRASPRVGGPCATANLLSPARQCSRRAATPSTVTASSTTSGTGADTARTRRYAARSVEGTRTPRAPAAAGVPSCGCPRRARPSARERRKWRRRGRR